MTDNFSDNEGNYYYDDDYDYNDDYDDDNQYWNNTED